MSDMPPAAALPPDAPEFSTVDSVLTAGLRERGLAPQPDGDRAWQTGLPGLRLEKGEVEVVSVGGGRFFADVEIIAAVDHPTYGTHTIADRVSLDDASADAVLAECVELYLNMTFDPIRALFDDALFAEPAIQLVSVVDPGHATAWNLYATGLDVRGVDYPALVEALPDGAPLTLLGGTLAGYFALPHLHWCKVYGECAGDSLEFGCIIDGQRDSDGEREMPAKFELPPAPSHWAYRGFMILVPHGEPDAATADALRTELGPPPKKGRFSFGKPKRRVLWRTV